MDAPTVSSTLCRKCTGFPGSSAGKESTCNAGDLGSIPGLGRSPGEGIGYPLQYSWASLVAQLVKNLPALQETWVRSLGWEDPLEKGKAMGRTSPSWGCSLRHCFKQWTYLGDAKYHEHGMKYINCVTAILQLSECIILGDKKLEKSHLHSVSSQITQNKSDPSSLLLTNVFSCSVVSPSLRPHGL